MPLLRMLVKKDGTIFYGDDIQLDRSNLFLNVLNYISEEKRIFFFKIKREKVIVTHTIPVEDVNYCSLVDEELVKTENIRREVEAEGYVCIKKEIFESLQEKLLSFDIKLNPKYVRKIGEDHDTEISNN